MLEDKKEDLSGEKVKRLLERMVRDLGREHPDLYYQPTSHIARLLHERIAKADTLNGEERELTAHLGQRDIQVLLSMNS
ncbi:MAG: hypothetical protein AAFY52_02870 [Pseudomonadota bacterium]